MYRSARVADLSRAQAESRADGGGGESNSAQVFDDDDDGGAGGFCDEVSEWAASSKGGGP